MDRSVGARLQKARGSIERSPYRRSKTDLGCAGHLPKQLERQLGRRLLHRALLRHCRRRQRSQQILLSPAHQALPVRFPRPSHRFSHHFCRHERRSGVYACHAFCATLTTYLESILDWKVLSLLLTRPRIPSLQRVCIFRIFRSMRPLPVCRNNVVISPHVYPPTITHAAISYSGASLNSRLSAAHGCG